MQVLAVDDEKNALNVLLTQLHEALPTAIVHSFCNPREALKFAQEHPPEIAFLDVEMYGMTGLELARDLKGVAPCVNIIFVTAYREYAYDAMKLRSSGYLLKPACAADILEEVQQLRYLPTQEIPRDKLRVRTFGNFEVFDGTELVSFGRQKVKEIFAYLIDKRGGGVSTTEIATVLWEGEPYTRSLQKQIASRIAELGKILREKGYPELIRKNGGIYSLDIEQINCDYYDFLEGDTRAVNGFMNEYMNNYSWAEFTLGELVGRRVRT